jgi:hypothetical protein
MALPKIDKPLFEVSILSRNNQKVTMRPFVVKEEKILLMAQQSGEEKDILLAIKQVIQNCVQDPAFDVDKLATYELEYLFLKLRARSVNNIIEVSYRDNEDNKVYDFTIDLDNVEMWKKGNLSNCIEINETMGIIMQPPSVTILDNAPDNMTATEMVEYLIRSCIDKVYDQENVYPASEQTEEELKEFIDNLDVRTFTKIREFFDNLPHMYYKIEYTNSLGNVRTIELQTLSDFFTWG